MDLSQSPCLFCFVRSQHFFYETYEYVIEQTYYLMCVTGFLGVRNLRVVVREWGWGRLGRGELGLRQPHSHNETQRKRCFTSVFYEAVVSLRSSRPIRAVAWLTHT
uniref:SFRICE_027661 n=1 Tax=Spodoptera frugiperda TaxID=7108 RepID=A0A2H1W9D4_SPOFR